MIDSFFKNYFWSFHLAVLAICGYLVATIANVYVREYLRVPPSSLSAGVAPAAAKAEAPKASAVNVDELLSRNVFGAEREDLTPPPPEPEAAPEPTPGTADVTNLDNCEKSALRTNLVATMYVSTSEEDSAAVFVDPSKNEPETYRVSEKLLDQAEIIAIRWREVYVNNGGRCEKFSIADEEEQAKMMAGAENPVPIAAAPMPIESGAAPDMDLGKGVKQLSESEYEIPRAEIDNVLGNLNVIATQARIVPSFQNGKANGFKLFSIRPGSLYSKIGIQNGDVIQKINGYEMNSPDKALEIYSKLKDASSITVDLVRRGRTKTLSYGIR